MLRFPLAGLLDEQACHDFLLHILHPDPLYCPRGHPLPADQAPHRRRRPVISDYRCRQCGAVFNLFSGTIFWKTCYRCSTRVPTCCRRSRWNGDVCRLSVAVCAMPQSSQPRGVVRFGGAPQPERS
jgi:transposase-like protein